MEALDFTEYNFRSSYPHMGADDAATWSRFIRKYPTAFTEVAYDVAIGAGAPFSTLVNPATGGDVGRIYQRRIDVVARDGGKYVLIEVKPVATTSSLGQIQAYEKLFKRDFPGLEVAALYIVAGAFSPDIEFLLEDTDIQTFEV